MIYQYTWNPEVWSTYYASGPEILAYFQRTTDQFDLGHFMRLKHRVDHAEWLDQEGVWRVTITDLSTGKQFTDEAEIFVNAMGFLKYVSLQYCLEVDFMVYADPRLPRTATGRYPILPD